MLRVLLTAALVAFVVFGGATLVARAVDQQIVEYVLVTRNGVTLECERVVDSGHLYLEKCARIAP